MSTNLKFITGLSGEAHVKPAMDAQWHSALSGKETFVYDYGQKFSLSVNQAMSTMSIASGVGQIQGRLFIIEESLIETISYPNVPPEVGLTRIDTVVLHWGTSTRVINGETVTVNTCEFEYKKNPLANGQPETFAETDLNLGDTDAYYPMWHVTWTENGIQEVEEIFTVLMTKDKVLFYDASPSMGNSASLSDAISNYDVLDVYLVDNDGDLGFVSVPTSENQFIATITKGSAGNSDVYIKSAMYYVQTGTNTLQYNSSGRHIQGVFSSSAQSVSSGAFIAIKEVVGRKLGV